MELLQTAEATTETIPRGQPPALHSSLHSKDCVGSCGGWKIRWGNHRWGNHEIHRESSGKNGNMV